ncbi:hypothetical protein HMPREF9162_0180 [Selenomonas sp. oral taxon 137 str. F0430]|nr:hypothetical protein HMPREF9162_0180 [Selenomonas sp. oral taxon 137 str. F0430]
MQDYGEKVIVLVDISFLRRILASRENTSCCARVVGARRCRAL